MKIANLLSRNKAHQNDENTAYLASICQHTFAKVLPAARASIGS
jgi:hypothetical protein